MNLKEYLLNTRVRSDVGALYMIENGLVRVNGHTITDYTIPADDTDTVTILEANPRLRLDAPDSYWRARVMQEKLGFVGLGDSVLHVETRDGGFPLLVRDYSGEPFVITAKNISVVGKLIGNNPFDVKPGDVQTVVRSRVDVYVQELELDAIKAFQVMERLLPALKAHGRIVLFLSSHGRDAESLKVMASRFLADMLVNVYDYFVFKEGVYVYARRN